MLGTTCKEAKVEYIYLLKSHCHVSICFPFRAHLSFLLMVKLNHRLFILSIAVVAVRKGRERLQNPRARHRLQNLNPKPNPESMRSLGKRKVLQLHAPWRRTRLWLHLLSLTGQSSKHCHYVSGQILTNMVNTVTP